MLEKIVLPVERVVLESLGVNFVSMDYIDHLLMEMVEMIRDDRRNFRPELIVGIANGGVYPSIKLAEKLHLKYELVEANRTKTSLGNLNLNERFILGKLFFPYMKTGPILRQELTRTTLPKNILLVDDDCGTGKTLSLVRDYLMNFQGVERVKTASVFCYESKHNSEYIGQIIPKLNSFMSCSKRLPWCDVSPHYKEYSKRLSSLEV